MRLKPNIRGQLVLIVILLLLGFSIQFATNITAQSNLEYIQDNQFRYLDRDAEVAEKLIRLLRDTQSLVSVRLENIILSLLSQDISKGQVLISVYRDRYSQTLDLLLTRQERGYLLNSTQLNEVPVFLQRDEDKLDKIAQIVDNSSQSIYGRLKQFQGAVNRVITNAIFSIDNIVNEYFLNSTIYNVASTNLFDNMTSVDEQLLDLNLQISSNPDDGYTSSVRDSIVKIQNNLTTFSVALGKVQRDWISSPPNLNSTLNQSLDAFSASGLELITDIDNELSTLDTIITTDPDQTVLNGIITTFNQLENSYDQVTNVLGDLHLVYLQIKNYSDSDLIQVMNQVQAVTTNVKLVYDEEHSEFIADYNELQNDVRNSVQTLTIAITAFLGFLIFVIIIPILFNMGGSISRLRRDIRLLSQRKLYLKERKTYPDNELGEIERSFYRLASDLKNIVQVTQESSSRLAGISEELAAGTEEASASINEVSQTINTISSGATQQRSMITSIRNQLQELQTEIRRASLQINEASSFVQKVAQRTNILGLNASINAAKAGQFGRGFSIVAGEIRDLSISTKESADQISQLIDRINYSIREMVDGIQSQVGVIMDVAETTAKGSEQGSESTSEQVIMISEISETSADLAELASSLNEIMKGFDVEEKK